LLLFAFVVVVSFMPTAPASFFFHPTQVSFFIASFIFLLNLWESNVFFLDSRLPRGETMTVLPYKMTKITIFRHLFIYYRHP
jgi:hypothetical protein